VANKLAYLVGTSLHKDFDVSLADKLAYLVGTSLILTCQGVMAEQPRYNLRLHRKSHCGTTFRSSIE
jgi:hypothetical protein